MTVSVDFLQSSGFAEARDLFVATSSPFMKCACNFLGVLLAKIPQHAVLHKAELAGIDKERFAAAVAQGGGTGTRTLGFVFREEPDACGNCSIGEELAGQGDHACRPTIP